MPRKLLYRSNFLPYHLTARTNNKEPFPIALEEVWEIIATECFSAHHRFEFEIHALVVMPNHFHMIVTVPSHDVGVVMHTLMRNITKQIQKRAGRSGHLFGGPYHWSLINTANYFYYALKYVYRNPVEAGLCEKVEQYKFSTYAGLIGETSLPFPISYTRAGMEFVLPGPNPIDWLKWLNHSFPKDTKERVQAAMRKEINILPFEQLISE